MAKSTIDVESLYADLDRARSARGLSWRGLAAEIGVSSALLSRIGNGLKPDTDGFVTLVRWLRMPAEHYYKDPDGQNAGEVADDAEPELIVSIGALLRSRKDIDDKERNYLEGVLKAAIDGYRALK